jgi:hypothetical protein
MIIQSKTNESCKKKIPIKFVDQYKIVKFFILAKFLNVCPFYLFKKTVKMNAIK